MGGGRGRWAQDDREEAGKLINKAEAAARCLGMPPQLPAAGQVTRRCAVRRRVLTTEGYVWVDEWHMG